VAATAASANRGLTVSPPVLAAAGVLFAALVAALLVLLSWKAASHTEQAGLAGGSPVTTTMSPAAGPLTAADRSNPEAPHADASESGGTLSPLSIEEVVMRAMPAVVTVETPDGYGSGFFVAADTLLSNAHVVESHSVVTLHSSGGSSTIARVSTSSYDVDLAVLKVDRPAPDQVFLPLASQSDVHVGAEVIAIGSPLGLQNTVTRGIVSGMRTANGVKVVQTDAAINPGNSGGPLIDRYGRVIGVNTLRLAGRTEAIGFAVSIHYARVLLGSGFAPKSEDDQR
jgi:S1-C subfamily serine protease